jgi:eukaryotic-like serine/threonine-protein kinase
VTFPGYPSFQQHNPSRQPPLVPGEVLASKYRIDRVLGAGAMGVVALAWHIELEQQVAIKFLYPELAADEGGAERFRREARAAVRIRNEHVARVLDVGTLEAQGIPYIVMEYLHGRDLARELAARGRLPVGDAARYLLEACEAVAEAHTRGIVHRDLKPANLFLAEGSNGGLMIKVLDFGISKVTSSNPERLSITDTAVLMGSPAYMSPEQLESSRNVDGRSDIWSLGVILYELVMGALPFGGDSVPQLVRAVISGARAPLTDSDASLGELEAIVARCLQQDRSERFQTVGELHAALERFVRPNAPAAAGEGSASAIGFARPSVEGPQVSAGADTEAAAPAPPPGTPESAWGRTHGGRRGSWQRHGVAIGALAALLGGFGFWLLERGDHPGEGSARGRDGSALDPARVETAVTQLQAPPSPLPQLPPSAPPQPAEAPPSAPVLPLDAPSAPAANAAVAAPRSALATGNGANGAVASGVAPATPAATSLKAAPGAGASPAVVTAPSSSLAAAAAPAQATARGAAAAPPAPGVAAGGAGGASANGSGGAAPSGAAGAGGDVSGNAPASGAADAPTSAAPSEAAADPANRRASEAAAPGDRFEIPEFGGRK